MKNLFVKTTVLFSILVLFFGCKPNNMVLVDEYDGGDIYVSSKMVTAGEWMSEMEFLPEGIIQTTVVSTFSDYFANYRISGFKSPYMTSMYNDVGKIYKDFLIKNDKFFVMYENAKAKQVQLDEKKYNVNFEYETWQNKVKALEDELKANERKLKKPDLDSKEIKKLENNNKKLTVKLENLKKKEEALLADIKSTFDEIDMLNQNIESLSNSQEFIDINNFLDYVLSQVKYNKGAAIPENMGHLEKVSFLNSKFLNGNSFYLLDEAKEYEINKGVSTYESIRHYMSNILTKRFMNYMSSNVSNAPIIVDALQAAMYCNQLSLKEGLSPCYTIDADTFTFDVTKDGYRLPTEEELGYLLENNIVSGESLYEGIDSTVKLPFFVVRVK